MPSTPANPQSFDPRFQTERLAIDPEKLVNCESCGRSNPPNRSKCIYCAAAFEIAAEARHLIKPELRKIEAWEPAYNVTIIGRSVAADSVVSEVAAYLSIEVDNARAILDADAPLPIARTVSEIDADVVRSFLRNKGITCIVVSDAELAAEKPPVRLSKIELSETGLVFTDFNTREKFSVSFDDLALIVPGIILGSRTDLLEKKGRGRTSKLIDEVATANDEPVLDLYTHADPRGFRVHITGFDYTILGDDKGLLAGENMRQLVVKLKELVPGAAIVNNYAAVRHKLGVVWEIESRKDVQGLQRAGFGKVEFGSVASTSNLRQFNKYSRLQWHLLKRNDR